MITIFQKSIKDTKAKTGKAFKPGSWINVEDPTPEEITDLNKFYKLDESLITDALDPFEVPRLEIEDNIVYVYTRVPVKDNENINTVPLVIVVAKEYLATICARKLPFLENFESGKINFYTTQKTKLFTQLFAQINIIYTQFLTDINRQVRRISVRPEKIKDKDIYQFVRFEETLNMFLSDLVPASSILKQLLSGKYLPLYESDKESVEDLLLSAEQLIETGKSNLRTIVNIREAYQTIMTNNLNKVIKMLTVITVLFTIPTFIAGLWGMNVKLPFEGNPNAFWYILQVITALCLFVLFLFMKKGWF